MTYEDIIKDIDQKKFGAVYFLTGDQPYYIDLLSDAFENNILSEAEKPFNLIVKYGLDSDVRDIILQARQYPMLGSQQVIIVKEAQNLKSLNLLETYLENPTKTTILVICYKYNKLDGRTSFAKKLKTHAVVYESPHVYEDKIYDWIINYCNKKNYKIDPKSAMLLGSYVGGDLKKIVNELEKIFISLNNKKTIDPNVIERQIGISKDFNVFELNNAIGYHNVEKAIRIVLYFADNEKNNPIQMVIGVLYSFFSKILKIHDMTTQSREEICRAIGVNSYFFKDYQAAAKNYGVKAIFVIFSILKEYDLKSKGLGNVSATSGELLKEMIYKILIVSKL